MSFVLQVQGTLPAVSAAGPAKRAASPATDMPAAKIAPADDEDRDKVAEELVCPICQEVGEKRDGAKSELNELVILTVLRSPF